MASNRVRQLAEHVCCQTKVHSPIEPSPVLARSEYDAMYKGSLENPEGFWGEAAKGLDWVEPYSKLLESKEPFYKWFCGGKISICHNAVDRHVSSRGDQPAIIYDSPMTKSITKISYSELQNLVARAAGGLAKRGVKSGDRAILYMPMIPEAAIGMLACARLGAIHSVVFGGFAPKELAVRIDDAEPVVILAATCGLEPGKTVAYIPMVKEAIELSASKPSTVVVKQRPEHPEQLTGEMYLDWDKMMAGAEAVPCTIVDSNHPLYILYTSGSTGKPKGILRDSAPHAVALKWSMSNFMRTNPGEVYWAASDVGWVVGHSYIVYGPLLHGCTTVLFEGKPVGTPDAGTFWRVISQHKVRGFFTAPTALRAIRKEDPNLDLVKNYDLSSLRALFVAGERCDPTTSQVYAEVLKVDVLDNWWQTETGWPICGFLDDKIGSQPGSCSLPMPGYDLQVLDDAGKPVPRGTVGTLAVKLPMPPSCFPTLWRNDAGYISNYLSMYPGYYASGDAGVIDENGYVTVLERTDDVINVAAHRLSTGGIEAVIKAQAGVVDCAVVGVQDDQKGQVPVALVVLNAAGAEKEADLFEAIRASVRKEIGGIASLAGLATVSNLPRTRSGKVLRKNIRGLADGKEVAVPGTIENPAMIDVSKEALGKIGYPKRKGE
eukprot:CAMPEP_0206450530 /NCGR_PEP_ID=MMETSP0324_2-20121206/18782_1 /ASSEMBLY_ACC=CAM_ASM_000836 /TAXON_ID=2866 /ORGANISM="Crypthecodinium cohnii, Strain Seligo" /LENGTH=660 /DNA_ID=CAMNT_0053920201 /DNA_START=35 /DNA_END=2017 /DNA_ORIENTATION=-